MQDFLVDIQKEIKGKISLSLPFSSVYHQYWKFLWSAANSFNWHFIITCFDICYLR